MPTENKPIEPQPEVKRWQLKGFLPGVEGECKAVFRPVVVLADDFDRIVAEHDALQQRLNEADQRIDELERDKDRLDTIEANFWDVRHHSGALADTGDYTSSIEIVGHWMDKPTERVIGENYSENLRAAIDQAMTAPAYPPARPEYPEIDALLDAAAAP